MILRRNESDKHALARGQVSSRCLDARAWNYAAGRKRNVWCGEVNDPLRAARLLEEIGRNQNLVQRRNRGPAPWPDTELVACANVFALRVVPQLAQSGEIEQLHAELVAEGQAEGQLVERDLNLVIKLQADQVEG